MPRSVAQSLRQVRAQGLPDAPPAARVGVFLKLDADVVEWFRDTGPGYQARINHVLKEFVDGVRHPARSPGVLARAQELFEQYYAQCFWHMRPDLIVTERDLAAVVHGLRVNGGREGYLAAESLCR
jgi:hypothetical protein